MSRTTTGPTMIVCRDNKHRAYVRMHRKNANAGNVFVVSALSVSDIAARSPQTIIICEGVRLGEQLRGEGRLGDVLRSRQKVWGDDAVWIEL